MHLLFCVFSVLMKRATVYSIKLKKFNGPDLKVLFL